ncbi:3-deoxy-manno-octulosonate cytidylyltransferase [Bacteroidota bacterium]
MKILGVIPSRYASTRFPGKPLVDILGQPMVWRVYEQAVKAKCFQKIIVATDDQRIYKAIEEREGNVVMTSDSHKNGTERCVEAMVKAGEDFDYVVNIQGDEPFIQPEPLGELCELLDGEVHLATLVSKITDQKSLINPGVMKVIFNNSQDAIYFSRQAIPFIRDSDKDHWHKAFTFYKHVCIYAYRSDILPKVASLEMTPLEKAESLEQLRWIEHGYKIKAGITNYDSISIDTPEDLERALQGIINKT